MVSRLQCWSSRKSKLIQQFVFFVFCSVFFSISNVRFFKITIRIYRCGFSLVRSLRQVRILYFINNYKIVRIQNPKYLYFSMFIHSQFKNVSAFLLYFIKQGLAAQKRKSAGRCRSRLHDVANISFPIKINHIRALVVCLVITRFSKVYYPPPPTSNLYSSQG